MNGYKKNMWKTKTNEIISCDEKIKVLNENFKDLELQIQNTLDDAVLMECDEFDLKLKIFKLVKSINSSFKK
tara:strand:+ start:614 stop:829 length:216 start_codon:yes stop_codon:yes gene_type:complete